MTHPLKRSPRLALGLALGLAILSATPALAQRTLTVGDITSPSSMDPHFHSTTNNSQALFQIFDALVDQDEKGGITPRLATAWTLVDDLTWEITLRPGVAFHDGTPFTADDIAFTLARVPAVPNSPGPYTPYVRSVAAVEVVSPTVLRIRTHEPNPYLLYDLAQVMLLSRRIHQGASTADFNSGKLVIGTGPYRHERFIQNERHELTRNQAYHAPAPWDRVVTRYIPGAGARVAALLAGEVDLIGGVPAQDMARLRGDAAIALFGTESQSTAYLFPDTAGETAAFVTDKAGQPLPRNPLRDLRVRRALSLAINRAALVERLLVGQGAPAEQFAPPSVADRAPEMPPLGFDVTEGRRLLAEAGYPDGFRMTIHGPGGFFPGDSNVLQSIAQGFSRIGVETQVEVLPPSVFFTRATNRDFSLFLTTYSSGLAANTLRQVVATKDAATGYGPFNRQLYSNPGVDRPLAQAFRTMDPAARQALTTEAMQAAIGDLGVVPVFYLRWNWAARRDRVIYAPNPQGRTFALSARPAN